MRLIFRANSPSADNNPHADNPADKDIGGHRRLARTRDLVGGIDILVPASAFRGGRLDFGFAGQLKDAGSAVL